MIRLLSAHALLDDSLIWAVRDRLGLTVACGPRDTPPQPEPPSTLLVTSGWAGVVCGLPDGRRHIVSLLLPGDFIRPPLQAGGLEVVALTSVQAVEAGGLLAFLEGDAATSSQPLVDAWRALRDDREKRLIRHAIRLGRLTAYERTADLFLELFERQLAVGMARDFTMAMPLTQDVLADHLGLSAVHVNRTMQQLRRDGLIVDRAGRMTIPDPGRLAKASPRPCGS